MKIIAVRHTRPDIGEGICYGQTDLDVLPSFKQDVRNIQEALKENNFAKIYTSPLKRCYKLALAIHEDEVLVIDDRLKELNFGDWELRTWKEIEQKPEGKNWFDDYINVPCPNGESYNMLLNRVKSFLDSLDTSFGDIVIVCHAGIIVALQVLINKVKPGDAFKISPRYGELVEFILD